jgi:nucleoside 2-deoxyribosyltransferase
MRSRFRRLFGRLLIVILALNGFLGFIPSCTAVQAQDKADAVKENERAIKERNRAIIVNADQPNVWTLEQAHYLLAQMHRRNL